MPREEEVVITAATAVVVVFFVSIVNSLFRSIPTMNWTLFFEEVKMCPTIANARFPLYDSAGAAVAADCSGTNTTTNNSNNNNNKNF